MENNKRDIVDWGLIISALGVILVVFAQTVQVHERITKVETIVTDEAVLCDCFNTRSRVGVLEHRVNHIERQQQQ